jgi:hypothetical protein
MLYVVALIVFDIGVLLATSLHLWKHRLGIGWWNAFSLLALAGGAPGIWLGVFFEYQASAQLRVAGFPLPLALFVLENGNWIDYVHSRPITYSLAVINILAGVAVALVPLAVASRIVTRAPTAKHTNERG